MLNSLFTDWSEWIEKPLSCDDIKKKIQKLKVYYLIVGIISFLLSLIGLGILIGLPFLTGKLAGLVLFIIGLSGALGIDIWAYMHLSMYKILWEMNRRSETNIEHELRRSEAQDL